MGDFYGDEEESLKMIVFSEYGGLDAKKKKIVKLPKECYEPANRLKIIPYPTNKQDIPQRPFMKEEIIPSHPSRTLFNGKSGSGKSNLLVNLMSRSEYYGADKDGKGYFDLVFLFSPTCNGGDDLVRFLDIPKKRMFNTFDEKTLDNIVKTQKKIIEEKKDLLKSPKILVIFEDIQSDEKFMSSKSFEQCFLMGRHFNMSIFLLGQSWTKTPRVCRLQASNIFFFAGSRSEQKLLNEEFNPPRLSKREFDDLIEEATGDDYGFLHINCKTPFRERYRQGLETVLKLKK